MRNRGAEHDDLDITAIRLMMAEISPGPWHWTGYKSHSLTPGPYIATWMPGIGRTTVMDTARLGMRGAQPRFNSCGRMLDGVDLAVPEVTYRDDIVDIDHPDARFMVAAPGIVRGLLAELDRMMRERDALMAVAEFAFHDQECHPDGDCTCGFVDALNALDGAA